VRRPAAIALGGLLLLSACGSAAVPDEGTTTDIRLTVLAAASLTQVLPEIGALYTKAHPGVGFAFSFGGTDQLAAQIEQGAPADLFAGASLAYGDRLAGEHLIRPYRAFCTNRLVLVTPGSNPAGITSLEDLATKPAKLVIGSESVPVGAYTRKVLANLDGALGVGYSRSVLARVVSNEDSVTAIVTKVRSGEADAGFVYLTDARAAGSNLRAIDLPADAQAVATYPLATVAASSHAAAGNGFVAFVLTAPAQRILHEAGFGPPPAS
jgi:molybdate transport system substrate-binding protein